MTRFILITMVSCNRLKKGNYGSPPAHPAGALQTAAGLPNHMGGGGREPVLVCGYRTYNDLISEDPETVSTVRRIAQRKLEEELEYVETDSVYSYRL